MAESALLACSRNAATEELTAAICSAGQVEFLLNAPMMRGAICLSRLIQKTFDKQLRTILALVAQ
jgi:hypothetical protein